MENQLRKMMLRTVQVFGISLLYRDPLGDIEPFIGFRFRIYRGYRDYIGTCRHIWGYIGFQVLGSWKCWFLGFRV